MLSYLFSRYRSKNRLLPIVEFCLTQLEYTTPIYFRQVYIMNGARLYLITARFFSAELMEAQAGVVDKVIESIVFTPIAE